MNQQLFNSTLMENKNKVLKAYDGYLATRVRKNNPRNDYGYHSPPYTKKHLHSYLTFTLEIEVRSFPEGFFPVP